MASHLVIVESPAKAKTISRFLGKDYRVEASMGHIRDLPSSGLGVDLDTFQPTYEVSKEKAHVVKALKSALKKGTTLWIATDEDREGEAIGWHLLQALGVKKTEDAKRIAFHEITKEAVQHAIENPRTVDMQLVDAQQARRVLDRLVGYTLSPFLWKKVYTGLSAGRVQSVAVRILVDREREIMAFVPKEYWTIEAKLSAEGQTFTATLTQKDGEKIAIDNENDAMAVKNDLEKASYTVASLEEKEVKRTPPAPFTTSTLQQEASRKLGFSVKQTMVVAQQLYEGIDLGSAEGSTGLITYMRTDSVNLSNEAISQSRTYIEKELGKDYLPASARTFKTKSRGAQEAHEAIRPTTVSRNPASLSRVLDDRQLKLYTLIWNRTVASQMTEAVFRRVGADITADRYTLRATGQTMVFPGYLKVYLEGREDYEADENSESILPPLKEDQQLPCEGIDASQHFTKPPARYTEASLVKKLEEEGIGRPSTYAPTISTIQNRGYVRKEGRALIPEPVAFTVTDLLTEHFPSIVDLTFTAGMEESLDDIAEGKEDSTSFLGKFYTPFSEQVDQKTKEVKKSDVMKEHVIGNDPKTGDEVIVRMGRFGPYVQLGRAPETDEKPAKGKKKPKLSEMVRTASLPKSTNPEEVTLDQALALLAFPKELGTHESETVVVQLGRFGPYVSVGKKTASLGDIDPSSVTLEQAIQLVKDQAERKKQAAAPLRVLGENADKKEVVIKTGRFGPYVTDGSVNASLGKKFEVETITLTDAIDLLAKKAASPKKKFARKKTAKKSAKKT